MVGRNKQSIAFVDRWFSKERSVRAASWFAIIILLSFILSPHKQISLTSFIIGVLLFCAIFFIPYFLFVKFGDSYTAGAVSALVRLVINSDTVAKGISDKDRYVLNLCLNEGFTSNAPDIANLQSYRFNRPMQLWDTASPYINRDTMANVCGKLMQEASSYTAVQNHLNFLRQTTAK